MDSQNHKTCVAILTPMLSGLYYPPLILNLMQLCNIKRHKVKVIKTGQYGEYDSLFTLGDVDIVILLRNAVHVNLVKQLRAMGKVVVSVSYDYFPLDVPCVSSDHEHGIKLSFEELHIDHNSRVAFFGNLHNYDIRKRYEAFMELAEEHHLKEDQIFVYPVKDDLVEGGYEAAKAFRDSDCPAQSLVFGTTQSAIGFITFLRTVNDDREDTLSIVSFDANSMVPVVNPRISTVDLNLNLIAHKALSVAEDVVANKTIDRKYSIAPRMISQQSDAAKSAELYTAISPEKLALSDPNYMKCALYNIQEWCEAIAASNLDSVMTLKPLFPHDLDRVYLSKIRRLPTGQEQLSTCKSIGFENPANCIPPVSNAQHDISNLPESMFEDSKAYEKSIHLVSQLDPHKINVISVMSHFHPDSASTSLVALFAYFDWISDRLSSNGKAQSPEGNSDECGKRNHGDATITGTIDWDTNSNNIHWDDEALSLLGFNSDLDKGVYRNMEVFDRLNEQDVPVLREFLVRAEQAPFTHEVHFRHKDRQYYHYELSTKGITQDGKLQLQIRSN